MLKILLKVNIMHLNIKENKFLLNKKTVQLKLTLNRWLKDRDLVTRSSNCFQ